MNRILKALSLMYFSASVAQAQSELTQNLPLARIESLQVILTPTGTTQPDPDPLLPDNPIPVLASLQDGPAPCPGGNGKSCALLGGRAYFSDPFHMTEHDASLKRAIRNPAMLVAFGLNLAATVADAEGTHACLRVHTCSELNPLLGSKPSRARIYGTVIPIDLVAYVAFAMMKKQGRGNLAFGELWGVTMAHTYFASMAWSNAHVAPSTNTSSAKGQ
jgi:hypothetical protein